MANAKKKQEHFERLYIPIHDRFERFCRARVYGGMDHADLINETLLVAYERLDQLRSEAAFFSFLCTISVRLLANNHRKMKPEYVGQDEKLNHYADSSAKTEAATEATILYENLARLPDVQKEALILFEISGFSIREIAQMQDSSIDAVKQRLKRGREKLRSLLEMNYSLKHATSYGES